MLPLNEILYLCNSRLAWPYSSHYFIFFCLYLNPLNFRFADDIQLMTGQRPGIYWLICWKYLSPLAMLSILVSSFVELATEGSAYDAWIKSIGDTERKPWPVWAVLLVLVLVLASVLWIPVVAVCRLVINHSNENNIHHIGTSHRRSCWPIGRKWGC